MIVTLNGYTINAPGSNVYLSQQILGLDLPTIRSSSGNYAGRDGGYVGAQFYGPRAITLVGQVFASDITALEATRVALQNAVRSSSIALGIQTNAGNSYIIYCSLLNFEMPITQELFEAPFKIDLFAGDPTIFDNSAGGSLTVNVPKLTSGGYTYPVVYPVVYAAGSSPTTVNNAGQVTVYPTITLTGQMTNPVIQNVTTGQTFSLTSLVTSPGDVVVIDMRARTVLLNGGNIFGLIGVSSSFWGLQPGNNSVQLTSGSGGDTFAGVLTYRSGYVAI